MTTQSIIQTSATALQQLRIELGEAERVWDRHHEVARRITDQSLDFALSLPLPGRPKRSENS